MNTKGSISVLIVVLKKPRLKMTASYAVGRSEEFRVKDAYTITLKRTRPVYTYVRICVRKCVCV